MFKVGDKLRVKAEFNTVPDVNCGSYRAHLRDGRAEYIVVTKIKPSGSLVYDIFDKEDVKVSNCEACLHDRHLEYYGESMPPRTFMLRKDTPSMLKGALLQDNGNETSPYVMINADTHCKDPSYVPSFKKRDLIEEAPSWFIEVFQVQPQYMTQAELDQFESFKKTLTKKKAKKA